MKIQANANNANTTAINAPLPPIARDVKQATSKGPMIAREKTLFESHPQRL